VEKRELKRKAILRFSFGAIVYAGIFFSTAGTFRYWEAWLFMATLFIPMILSVRYFLRTDPEFLRRRLKAREERGKQKVLQVLGTVFWIPLIFIPGLDHRLGWTTVPVALVLLADVLVLVGYYLAFLTMRENRYASRTIKVEEGQEVITTGPYARVRHPMYVGTGLMVLASPVALGSYVALVPTLLAPVFLVLRILDEEKVLREELPGYREYSQQVRYRLIPGLW
jgi:protein-S-isoprenylcysteine O-methyltransferase Ste14